MSFCIWTPGLGQSNRVHIRYHAYARYKGKAFPGVEWPIRLLREPSFMHHSSRHENKILFYAPHTNYVFLNVSLGGGGLRSMGTCFCFANHRPNRVFAHPNQSCGRPNQSDAQKGDCDGMKLEAYPGECGTLIKRLLYYIVVHAKLRL